MIAADCGFYGLDGKRCHIAKIADGTLKIAVDLRKSCVVPLLFAGRCRFRWPVFSLVFCNKLDCSLGHWSLLWLGLGPTRVASPTRVGLHSPGLCRKLLTASL